MRPAELRTLLPTHMEITYVRDALHIGESFNFFLFTYIFSAWHDFSIIFKIFKIFTRHARVCVRGAGYATKHSFSIVDIIELHLGEFRDFIKFYFQSIFLLFIYSPCKWSQQLYLFVVLRGCVCLNKFNFSTLKRFLLWWRVIVCVCVSVTNSHIYKDIILNFFHIRKTERRKFSSRRRRITRAAHIDIEMLLLCTQPLSKFQLIPLSMLARIWKCQAYIYI